MAIKFVSNYYGDTIGVHTPDAAPKKFYGTQPAVLPETLPAGTRLTIRRSVLDEELVLGKYGSEICYMRNRARQGAGYAWPKHVDWSTVEVQPAQPSQESDSAWCVRQLEEYTGQPAKLWATGADSIAVANDIGESFPMIFSVQKDMVERRDADWFRQTLKRDGWPRAQAKRETFGEKMQREYNEMANAVLRDVPINISISTEAPKPDPYRAHAMLMNIDEATVGERTMRRDGQGLAALRTEAAFAKEKQPRKPTADDRELSKRHPWECGGEDEP